MKKPFDTIRNFVFFSMITSCFSACESPSTPKLHSDRRIQTPQSTPTTTDQYAGILRPLTHEIHCKTDGKIEAIHFSKGATISRNKVIVTMDNYADFQQLKQAKETIVATLSIALQQLPPHLQTVSSKWEKFKSSIAIDQPLPLIPTIAFREERDWLAQTGILNQLKAIVAAEKNYSKSFIQCPTTGKIEAQHLKIGQILKRGQKIATITEINRGQLETSLNLNVNDTLYFGGKMGIVRKKTGSNTFTIQLAGAPIEESNIQFQRNSKH